MHLRLTAAVALQLVSVTPSLHAATVTTSTGDEQAKLAMQLNNPVAALISVPLQSNWDFGIGPRDAYQVQAQRPAGRSNHPQRGLEPHLPDHPPRHRRRVPGTGHRRCLRPGKLHPELLPLPAETDRRNHLGRRSRHPDPDRDGRPVGSQSMGSRSDRRRTQTNRRLDLRRARQSDLVIRGRKRRDQRHLPTTVRLIHHQDTHHLPPECRVHLRLGGQPVVDPLESGSRPTGESRQAARAVPTGALRFTIHLFVSPAANPVRSEYSRVASNTGGP